MTRRLGPSLIDSFSAGDRPIIFADAHYNTATQRPQAERSR